MKKLIWANFKMYKNMSELKDYFTKFNQEYAWNDTVDVVVAPMMVNMMLASEMISSKINLWSQNMHPNDIWAYTGETSPLNLKELWVKYVILWHSERRTLFGESDAFVNEKVKSALKHWLRPILCIWETLEEKQSEKTYEVLERQIKLWLKDISDIAMVDIAYEPVWAIGTGLSATPEYVMQVHNFIRWLIWNQESRIIYWWSVNDSNAKDLISQKDVNWFLIGSASLDPTKFINIINTSK